MPGKENIGIPGTGKILHKLWGARTYGVRALGALGVVAVGLTLADAAVDGYGSVPVRIGGVGTDISAGIAFGDTDVVEDRLAARGVPFAIHIGDAEIGVTIGRRNTDSGLDIVEESALPANAALVTTGESATVFLASHSS